MGTGEKGQVPECFATWWWFLRVEALVQRHQDILVSTQILLEKTPPFWLLQSLVPYVLFLFNRSVVSDSFRFHGLQQARVSCPSPSPEFAQAHVH